MHTSSNHHATPLFLKAAVSLWHAQRRLIRPTSASVGSRMTWKSDTCLIRRGEFRSSQTDECPWTTPRGGTLVGTTAGLTTDSDPRKKFLRPTSMSRVGFIFGLNLIFFFILKVFRNLKFTLIMNSSRPAIHHQRFSPRDLGGERDDQGPPLQGRRQPSTTHDRLVQERKKVRSVRPSDVSQGWNDDDDDESAEKLSFVEDFKI